VDASTANAPPPGPVPDRRPGRSLHRFANPGRFLRVSSAVLPFLSLGAAVLLATGPKEVADALKRSGHWNPDEGPPPPAATWNTLTAPKNAGS
jgi:hypothetical protein